MRPLVTATASRQLAILCLGIAGMTLILVAASAAVPMRGFPPRSKSLLETIEGWKYPGAKMPNGAEANDGGFAGILSTSSKTILTTEDPIENVIAYYTERLTEAKKHEPGSVAIQDDSRDRPVALKVFFVHTVDSSTTLVISRAKGEKETHIAWSQFWHKEVAK